MDLSVHWWLSPNLAGSALGNDWRYVHEAPKIVGPEARRSWDLSGGLRILRTTLRRRSDLMRLSTFQR